MTSHTAATQLIGASYGSPSWLGPMVWPRVLASAFRSLRSAIVSRHAVSLCVGAIVFNAGAVIAQDATRSVYTTIDLKTCKVVRKSTEGAIWRCPGLPGYPVYLAEGDDRMFVSVGPNPEKRRAAEQTLTSFNSIFPSGMTRATIEWRVPGVSGRTQPYATIVRYYTSNEQAKGQVLVVSKVTPTETCHAAYIDAGANADAIERARLAADTTVRSFNCSKAPVVEGARGKNPL
jgi:hypothetical protein